MMLSRLFLLALLFYRLALPGYQFEFPRDHGAHPEFKLEWWYFTGNLRDPEGRSFGYELTFFRTGISREPSGTSAWRVRDLHLAHLAVSDGGAGTFQFFEKVSREGPGLAGASPGRLEVWNQNWWARQEGEQIHLRAAVPELELELQLRPLKPPAVHGRQGVSQKGPAPGQASHYYSLSRLATRGRLRQGGKNYQVEGLSWMDHEFGTDQLDEGQIGWDWFSLQLENGKELMLFRLRREGGEIDPHSAGSLIDERGRVTHLKHTDFQIVPGRIWKSPASGAEYPVEWTLILPGLGVELRLKPLLDHQELLTTRSTGVIYWEGAVGANGVWAGVPVRGRGYVELTGYAPAYRPRI